MSSALHKACDACRSRKSRCKQASTADTCEFCLSRNIRCTFSYVKRPRKRKQNQLDNVSVNSDSTPDAAVLTDTPSRGEIKAPLVLYIDSLLADREASRIRRSAKHPDQLTAILGPNPNISFFPAKRVRFISERLGHGRLEQLLEDIRVIVAAKVRATSSIPRPKLFYGHLPDGQSLITDHESLKSHILLYFDAVHPIYPFLCPEDFHRRVAAPNLAHTLTTDKAWAALYYAVVAIGCQNNEGGSFEAGIGEAWSYFERSLECFQDLLFFRGSLTAVQALMAMAIFSSTASAFQFEPLMLSEAAIMAQGLGYNRGNGLHESAHRRTFWVLYFMEKVSCFITGKISVLQDSNISCAIPDFKDSTFDDYDWFFSFLRYARLVSKMYDSLFTVSSANQPTAIFNETVQNLLSELEAWRLSAPERFRAREPLKPRLLREPLAQTVALMTHYLYLNALLTLSWTLLHFGAVKLGTTQQLQMKRELMRTARSVLELTKFVDVAPSTPIWILAVMPLSSLMILFDLVVHNPEHPETSLSLALLDIAGGHFSRLEFASKGTLPGSVIAQFAHIARQYVSEKRHCQKNKTNEINIGDSRGEEPLNTSHEETRMQEQESSIELAGVDLSRTRSHQVVDLLHVQSQELPVLDPGVTPLWTPPMNGGEQLFIPMIDDPSYHLGDLELLGIDLKDLFDYPYAMLGWNRAT